MNIRPSQFQVQNLASIKQAINLSVMEKAMNRDGQAIDSLVKNLEKSVTPHLGNRIDLKV